MKVDGAVNRREVEGKSELPKMSPNAAVKGVEDGGAFVLHEVSGMRDGGAAAPAKESASQFSSADFRPVKALGSGDMGSVYLVVQKSSKAPYAMKVMNKEVIRSRDNGRRARAEKEILAAVNHAFLPVLHSQFEDEKHSFLVMNYCHGGDLNVVRHKQPEKRFSESACRFYAAEVVLALEYLHQRNIVYRDLKPENILVQADGHVMLTDFDLSLDLSERQWTRRERVVVTPSPASSPRLRKKNSLRSNPVKALFSCAAGPGSLSKKQPKTSPNSRITAEELNPARKHHRQADSKSGSDDSGSDGRANSFVGTEEYVAPEIIWGKGHGLPVDWWTLGILLYELYYGKTPFKGLNRKETFYSILCKPVAYPGISSPLTDLIKKLLTKDPEDRLGAKGDAEEIKRHPFFDGVNWAELPLLSRTPVVPDPFSWEQIERDLATKAAVTGKEVQSRWSFCEPTEGDSDKRESTSSTAESPLSLKSNDSSSYQDQLADTLMAKHFTREADDLASTPGNFSGGLHDEDEDCCVTSEHAFALDTQSEMYKQLSRSINSSETSPKEKDRLNDHEESTAHQQKLLDAVF